MILLKEIKEWKKVSTLQCTISETVILQLAPVVQKVNQCYPLDKPLSIRGTQQEHSSKPLEHSIAKRNLVFKREI